MDLTPETLLLDLNDSVLQITLDRPKAANAINTRMGADLLAVFAELAAKPATCRAVVLIGAGDRAFCAGGDLKEREGMSLEQWEAQHLIFEHMARAIVDCPVPIIAAVNGSAFGGGCEIALACDFIYATEGIRFALTEVTLGIMPGAGGTQTLPRAVGMRRAKELILSGQPFTAEEAHDWGMVNKLCAPGALLDEARQTAQRIAGNAPIAVRQAKHSIQHGAGMALADGMLFEIEAYRRMISTDDRQEGVRAFNEKRKPIFHGR